MKETGFAAFLDKLVEKWGGWYPFWMLVILQAINTPIVILLSAMPAQSNAEFNKTQGLGLLIFGGMAMIFRNVVLLISFSSFQRDMIARLAALKKNGSAAVDLEFEQRAWEQVNFASRRYVYLEFFGLVALVLLPTLLFGYFMHQLHGLQLIYLGLSILAAGLVNSILGSLAMDQWLEPVMRRLQPDRLEIQLLGIKGTRLWVKMALAIIGFLLVGLLLTIPTAFQQVNLAIMDQGQSPEVTEVAFYKITVAGLGAVAVGVFLSFRLISYISTPFQKIIRMLKDVEAGDLSRRMDLIYSDEFGSLSIYLNRMVDRLQKMTDSLEQQVAERTAQLQHANEQLQIELVERKRVQDQLAYAALHDSLTDISNRNLLMDRLQHVLEQAKRRTNKDYAVLFMDLDRFKVVNDSLGHNIGDLLLVESARRIRKCIRSEDTVARLGGDEFVILIEAMADAHQVIKIAERILRALAEPAELEGYKVFASTSIGIVLGDARYEKAQDVLRDADIAMYRAKRRGTGGYEIFDPVMLESVMSRLELERDLRIAIDEGQFVLHYQPVIDLAAQRMVGFEALLRWNHPTRGMVMPGDFIPLAEEIGLIVPIGYWVLDEACRQIGVWQEEFPSIPPVSISVNVSPRQCVEKDLVEKVAEVLAKYNLLAGSLNLDIAESLIMEGSANTTTLLARLEELGVHAQIDDFGMGYSSLGSLQTRSIETLKIDRAFIANLETDDVGLEVVRLIISLAHGLGMKVIAEGVETDRQMQMLAGLNCEYAQGYKIASPLDSREAWGWLG